MKIFRTILFLTIVILLALVFWTYKDYIWQDETTEFPPVPVVEQIDDAVEEKPHLAPHIVFEKRERAMGEVMVFPAEETLIPFRTSWLYQHILNRRPADGYRSELNPPRFSWPYLEDVVAPGRDQIPKDQFALQISRNPDFSDPIINIEQTPYNFYNALPVLEEGEWFWRFGYGAPDPVSWSDVWSFIIEPDAVEWDRTVIHKAARLLAQRPRPRSGPPDGDWAALNQFLRTNEQTRHRYRQLLGEAQRVLGLPWWNDLPETDVVPGGYQTRDDATRWVGMLKGALTVAYVYKLTGEEMYAGAIDRIVDMARWPRGGGLSPEALGGHTKLPSQAVEFFATAYDWYADQLTASEARVLREAIVWRLHDMYLDPNSLIWNRGEDQVRDFGLAYVAGSHPYQNYAWTLPAILLMAGDLQIADQLLPISLHYLTGVTSPEGPDEGYNEGPGYSNEKGGTLLTAAVVADMLLPELELGKNPVIEGFGEWMIFLFPGVDQLPWGDTWLQSTRGIGGDNLRYVTYLTGSPLANRVWAERGHEVAGHPRGGLGRAWFEFGSFAHYQDLLAAIPEVDDNLERTLFLPEAGWIFTHSEPIVNHENFLGVVGMQFQMRPRGGYSHSFPSDGSFLWFAYGERLTGGGGWLSWASLAFSRSPISQNTLLINGQGHQSINPYAPQVPFVARPLAFAETSEHTYWVADLTPGYRINLPVERVHRHVLFLAGKWFIIFDDIAMDPEADPALFSWLYHVDQEVPVSIVSEPNPGWDYRIGEVDARVRFGNPGDSLTIENRKGREGHINPITGEDHYPADRERALSREIFRPFRDAPFMANNLWVTTVEPSREHTFLSVLAANPSDQSPVSIQFHGTHAVTIIKENGRYWTVSFDPEIEADITIDVEAVRTHATEASH